MEDLHPETPAESPWTVRIYVAIILAVFMTACCIVAFTIIESYGLWAFGAIPFMTGFLAPVLIACKREPTPSESIAVILLAFALGGIVILFAAIEGLICLAMALPFVLLIALPGIAVGMMVSERGERRRLQASVLIVGLLNPLALLIDTSVEASRDVEPVTTSVVIDAPAEVVWRHVIEFAPLDPPTELLFRSGIAYPIRACIEGRGVGAVRYCDFSTGTFVEPITVWKESEHLAFTVREQPIPMRELSPYEDLEPAHLHGYFVSVKGEFRLTRLSSTQTKLDGTTWYYQRLRPRWYWDLWSDGIIHAIHGRVLQHIEREAERDHISAEAAR